MIETKQARIRDNSVLDFVKQTLTRVGPDAGNRLSLFLFNGKNSKGGDSKVKVMDVFAVELGKPNEFSNITNNIWRQPCLEQLRL
jgi:hypothetical protein